MAIAVVKGLAEPDLMEKAYGPLRLDLPMAPGLGLVLQEVKKLYLFIMQNHFHLLLHRSTMIDTIGNLEKMVYMKL